MPPEDTDNTITQPATQEPQPQPVEINPQEVPPAQFPPVNTSANVLQNNEPAPPPKKTFPVKKILVGLVILLIIIGLVAIGFFLYQKATGNKPSPSKTSDFSNNYYQFNTPKGWTFSTNASDVEGQDSTNNIRRVTIRNYSYSNKADAIEKAKQFASEPNTIKKQYINVGGGVGLVVCTANEPTCSKYISIMDNDLTVARQAWVKIVWEQPDKTKYNQEVDKRFKSIKDPATKMAQVNKFLQEQNGMDPAERDFEDQFFSNFKFAPIAAENSPTITIQSSSSAAPITH